nr:hypothetical protein [Rhodoferax sp.]
MAAVKTESKNAPACVMSGEQIVRELDELSDDVLLTPPQMEAIMQATSETLKNMRATGDGPLFVKLGGGEKSPVRYPLGEYRKWKAAHTYKNTSQLTVSRFRGMADFLSNGIWGEKYIVACDASGNQWDFWEAIKGNADVVDVQWKPMEQILEGFRVGAQARYARHEEEDLKAFVIPGKPDGRRHIDD